MSFSNVKQQKCGPSVMVINIAFLSDINLVHWQSANEHRDRKATLHGRFNQR